MDLLKNKLDISADTLLRQGTVERDRIEYSAGWEPDAIIRTICAFANDLNNLGGYVIIGQKCNPKGAAEFPPVGLSNDLLDKIGRELSVYCKLIDPPYTVTPRIELVEGRSLVVLHVPSGNNRPYKVPQSVTAPNKIWKYFIRRGGTTAAANEGAEYELATLLTAKTPFDESLNQAARMEDLSVQLMKDFLHQAGSSLDVDTPDFDAKALVSQMDVANALITESPWPKNIGLLFFNEAPQRFFPGIEINLLWFPHGVNGDRFDQKTFKGPLARMTREALDYIQRNYLHETIVKRPNQAPPTRIWNFPFAAIEQAIVNAVYHRSYEELRPIEVRITYEELTIISHPGPDRSIRMDDLKAGRAVSRGNRNRRIGEFFKDLKLAEGRGTGIPKIFRAMMANGSPVPKIETDDERQSFIVRLPVHPLAFVPRAVTAQVTLSSVSQVTPRITLGVSGSRVTQPFILKVIPQFTPQIIPRIRDSTAVNPRNITQFAPKISLRLIPQVTPRLNKFSLKSNPKFTTKVASSASTNPDSTPEAGSRIVAQTIPQATTATTAVTRVAPHAAPGISPRVIPQAQTQVNPQVALQTAPQAAARVVPQGASLVNPRVIPQTITQIIVPGVTTGQPPQPQVQVQPQTQAQAQAQAEIVPKVSSEVAKLLITIQGEMSLSQLMGELGLSDRKRFRDLYWQPALEQKLVEQTLPDKSRSNKQRYRLTATGLQWVKHHQSRKSS